MENVFRRLAAWAAVGFSAAAPAAARASAYDRAVLADGPVLYWAMDGGAFGVERDLSGRGHDGAYRGGEPGQARLPNGDPAAVFDGRGQFVSAAPALDLSIPAARSLTVESWIRPDVLQFPRTEEDGYVYWLGKGDPKAGYEYANRMYSFKNAARRPNRVSVYAWNKRGGLGSGAYFQDELETGRWIFVADVVDMDAGTIAIYRDGLLRGRVPLSQYHVTPVATAAPFNVGTRNGRSWFQGAVGKVAIFARPLTAAQIAGHYRAMLEEDP